jgi:hypothetical protein
MGNAEASKATAAPRSEAENFMAAVNLDGENRETQEAGAWRAASQQKRAGG